MTVRDALRLLLIVAAWVVAAVPVPAGAGPPNVLLIVADDLGYGDPGCYNPASKIPTPHIDRLAAAGMRFTDAHAPAAVCVPTRFALMTGRYPFRRPRRDGSVTGGPLIAADTPTLPGLFRTAGYRTAMVGKWHLGFDPETPDFTGELRGGPADRGFDSYFGLPASLDIPPYFWIEGTRAVKPPTELIGDHGTPGVSPIQGAFWRAGAIAPGFEHAAVLPTLADRAADTLENLAAADKPFFLYVALTAPHTPWLPTADFRGDAQFGDSPLSAYGDFVTQVDAAVGGLLDRLDAAGAADNTLVVFTSDNGPVWYDADTESTGHDAAGPWRGMKGDAWEAGHRVPLIVRQPGRVPAGRTCDDLVSLLDFLPTLAGMTGVAPPTASLDGQNLSPLWSGQPDAAGRRSLVLESSGGVFSLRQGPWKYIPQLGSGGFSVPRREPPQPGGPTAQLYDLATDPGETHNIALDQPNLAAALAAELDRVRKSP